MNLHQTDPEFMQRWEHFAFEEVVHEEGQQLPEKDRYLAILATLLGCQGKKPFIKVLPKALQGVLSPVEVKETVYQAVDYLGYGRILPFLEITAEVFDSLGIEQPVASQQTTTMEDRLERGAQTQADIFRAGHARSLEEWPYQSLAGCELFRGFLYSHRTYAGTARTDYVLFPGGTGWM